MRETPLPFVWETLEPLVYIHTWVIITWTPPEIFKIMKIKKYGGKNLA